MQVARLVDRYLAHASSGSEDVVAAELERCAFKHEAAGNAVTHPCVGDGASATHQRLMQSCRPGPPRGISRGLKRRILMGNLARTEWGRVDKSAG